ncbi:MAG TPA: hypothetical protein VMG11_14580 [Steroidobacteraceae bacterium]|nr:hypothetical protein [Steroidobacteraceae bacterium]
MSEVPPGVAAPREPRQLAVLVTVVALIAIGLLVYSQTQAFAWDEGYHLLAAQLILAGKRPYLDFLFVQTPLNAYWNAGWMALLGQSWHPVHAVAALLTAGAVLLAADFALVRFPVPSWRLAAALIVALAFGLNAAVFEFGTVGQAYGLCLFLSIAAFRLAVPALERDAPVTIFLAGLCAGGTAASSLLTAPVPLVLLAWIIIQGPPQARVQRALGFVAGLVLAFLPVLILLVQGPRQVLFGTVGFHVHYRNVDWATHAFDHDFGVLLSWIDSGQALLMGLLTLGALVLVTTQTDWMESQRAPFMLCGWLALALGVLISTAHPTFTWYYLLLVPFLALLTPVGLYGLSVKLGYASHPLRSALALMLLIAVGLTRSLHSDADDLQWRDYEELARKVDAVTPRDARLFADEHVYFLTHRPPPEGQTMQDSHKIEVSPALAALLHVVPQGQVERRIRAGYYDTVVMCDADSVARLGLAQLYARQQAFPTLDCTVFWQRAGVQQRDSRGP